jgi:hypothetical protein
MLKISVVDSQRRHRMIVEGALITPWTDEFLTACKSARANLQGLELVVDVRGLTAISADGANLLFQLMRDKVRLDCGVYVRELLRQLSRDARRRPREVKNHLNDAESEPQDSAH